MLPDNAANEKKDRDEHDDFRRGAISPPSKDRIMDAVEEDDWETAFREFFHVMTGQTFEEYKEQKDD